MRTDSAADAVAPDFDRWHPLKEAARFSNRSSATVLRHGEQWGFARKIGARWGVAQSGFLAWFLDDRPALQAFADGHHDHPTLAKFREYDL